MALRPGEVKAAGESQRTRDLADSLPFPVSEESEEGRRAPAGRKGLSVEVSPRGFPRRHDLDSMEGSGSRELSVGA